MKRKILTIFLLTVLTSSGISTAGVMTLTHHSRANCASFNESVSWHLRHSYWLWVVSRHRYPNKYDHQLVVDWAITWRAAAYHTNEGYGGWTVEGHHWMRDSEASLPYQVAQEFVADCSIYDGWWDH